MLLFFFTMAFPVNIFLVPLAFSFMVPARPGWAMWFALFWPWQFRQLTNGGLGSFYRDFGYALRILFETAEWKSENGFLTMK